MSLTWVAEMITELEGRPDLVTTAWMHTRPESGQEHEDALREASRLMEEGALFREIPPYELDMGECEDQVDGEVEGEGPDENTDEIALLADFVGDGEEDGEEEVEDHGETNEGEKWSRTTGEAQRLLYLRLAFGRCPPKDSGARSSVP